MTPAQPDLAPGTTFAYCIRCDERPAAGRGVLCAPCVRAENGLLP